MYDGVPKSVGDSKGMAYIYLLLQSPGKEMHAAALRSAVAGEENVPPLGSAGEVIDPRTRREYKNRISEIDEELAEAEANNDLARKDVLYKEQEAVYKALGLATGLGGRNRKAADDRKRATDSVCRAVRRALSAIKTEHEPLWQHLSNSLTIKELLSYHPDSPTTWHT